IVVSVILILAAFRVPLTALGAFSGVALAGLTLSKSTLLTNLFGGLFVVFNRKYSEGDIISSEINSTLKFSGTIKKIGTLTTRVDNSDTAPMHIPNSVFLNTCITTTSRRTHRRIDQFITIDYTHID
ncbi:mechanosensitive ion channel domain-containing protein, partial [Francisella tularensis]|uniref:mechanosensitive ion channel domain-containing protein n=1 Tax=Francisella tularensis TaxID=263 RepID=UPI00174DB7C0